jgi:hypothetical protein
VEVRGRVGVLGDGGVDTHDDALHSDCGVQMMVSHGFDEGARQPGGGGCARFQVSEGQKEVGQNE